MPSRRVLDADREIAGGDVAQHVGRLGDQFHRARRRLAEARPRLVEARQHQRAQRIAQQARIVVARIVDVVERQAPHVALDGVARHLDERPHELQAAVGEGACRRERGQPVGTGAAQPLDQEGLDAIVLVVRGQHELCAARVCRLGKRRVARLARRRLDAAAARLHGHAARGVRDLARRAERFAMRGPGLGGLLQSMVDVHGHEVAPAVRARIAQAHGGVEQRRGIAAAAEGDQDRAGAARTHAPARRHAERRLVDNGRKASRLRAGECRAQRVEQQLLGGIRRRESFP